MKPILYSYYRSSCSYRVRIALALKSIDYDMQTINLHPEVNEQGTTDYREINPQGRVPYFIDDRVKISQSMAILEYLEERYPQVPLLPSCVKRRAYARQLCQLIACDIQPLNNVAVLAQLRQQFGMDEQQRQIWYAHWLGLGFTALEQSLQGQYEERYACGAMPSLVDVLLVPQVWNALRFDIPLTPYPLITKIYEMCRSHAAFYAASPEVQCDSP